MVKKRNYEWRDLYKKPGPKPKERMKSYLDYLQESDYKSKDYWLKKYEGGLMRKEK